MRVWNSEQASEKIRELQHEPGALLPILHSLTAEFGYIDKAVIPVIAEALNLSQAEVYGVISFYHDFHFEPRGRRVLRICRAEACQSMGCEALIRHVENRLNVKLGATTANGDWTVEPVFCLGNCALSPAVMLDGEPYGRVSPSAIDFLIRDAWGTA